MWCPSSLVFLGCPAKIWVVVGAEIWGGRPQSRFFLGCSRDISTILIPTPNEEVSEDRVECQIRRVIVIVAEQVIWLYRLLWAMPNYSKDRIGSNRSKNSIL